MYRVTITSSGIYAVGIEGDYTECMEDIINLAKSGDPVILVESIEDLDALNNLTIDSETVQVIEGD
jgi:hypothetical protein